MAKKEERYSTEALEDTMRSIEEDEVVTSLQSCTLLDASDDFNCSHDAFSRYSKHEFSDSLISSYPSLPNDCVNDAVQNFSDVCPHQNQLRTSHAGDIRQGVAPATKLAVQEMVEGLAAVTLQEKMEFKIDWNEIDGEFPNRDYQMEFEIDSNMDFIDWGEIQVDCPDCDYHMEFGIDLNMDFMDS